MDVLKIFLASFSLLIIHTTLAQQTTGSVEDECAILASNLIVNAISKMAMQLEQVCVTFFCNSIRFILPFVRLEISHNSYTLIYLYSKFRQYQRSLFFVQSGYFQQNVIEHQHSPFLLLLNKLTPLGFSSNGIQGLERMSWWPSCIWLFNVGLKAYWFSWSFYDQELLNTIPPTTTTKFHQNPAQFVFSQTSAIL